MNRTPAFKPNARTIFDARYPRKDEDGNPAETPAETVERVGINVAMPNALYVPAPDVLPETTPNADGFPFATARRQYDWLWRREGLKPSEGIDLPTQLAVGWDVAMEQANLYMDELLVPLHFLPNSPTWTGAGTPLGQLAACFVLPVEDDLGQGPDSIMQVLYKATMIQQTGGGNGFSFGRLRPKNALVKRSMGRASGPMGFARVYNGAFKEIAQGAGVA
jgi:ribonucleotide reductase alpha subunit